MYNTLTTATYWATESAWDNDRPWLTDNAEQKRPNTWQEKSETTSSLIINLEYYLDSPDAPFWKTS